MARIFAKIFVEGAEFIDAFEGDSLVPDVVVAEVDCDGVWAGAHDGAEAAVSEECAGEEGGAGPVEGDGVGCGDFEGVEGCVLRGCGRGEQE